MSAVRRGRGGAVAGYAVISVLGAALLALHVRHAASGSENARTLVYGVVVPAGFTVALFVGLVWLARRERPGRDALRVAGWTLAGSAVLAFGALLVTGYQRAHGTPLHSPVFVGVDAVSIGSVVGFLIGVYDARLRRAKAAHETERERSERLNRQLGVLNRVLRHDIRNGANVIRGRAELLRDGDGAAPHVDAIEQRANELVEVGDQAQRIEGLIHARDSDRERIDLAAVVDAEVDAVVDEHGPVDLERSVPGEAVVSAHPLVELAVRNVVENAVVHCDDECPRVEVTLSIAESDRVVLRVADDGPGIPDEQVAVVERGYETPLEHTTGLGLWIVDWVVTASGGDVAFDRHDDAGTVVRLTFERTETTGDRERS